MKRAIIAVAIISILMFGGCGAPQSAGESSVKSNDVFDTEVNDTSYSAPPSISSSVSFGAKVVINQPKEEKEVAAEEVVEEPVVEEYYEEYYDDGSYIQTWSYDPDFGENGPTRQMPGWYDGNIETYYSSNVLYHYRTDEWTPDEEGFYRDDEGRYVVGVGVNDINPETGEVYQIGDTVQTGKGEGVVSDYGNGANVHDFYTNW